MYLVCHTAHYPRRHQSIGPLRAVHTDPISGDATTNALFTGRDILRGRPQDRRGPSPFRIASCRSLTHPNSQNFLALCASGYYDNTLWHRNIKGFMIQTGDPSGSGKGGQSLWGQPFADEIRSTLKVRA